MTWVTVKVAPKKDSIDGTGWYHGIQHNPKWTRQRAAEEGEQGQCDRQTMLRIVASATAGNVAHQVLVSQPPCSPLVLQVQAITLSEVGVVAEWGGWWRVQGILRRGNGRIAHPQQRLSVSPTCPL